MAKHDAISIRMKSNYESRAKYALVRRMPVILRVDGKSFHTYTKHMDKPFDSGLQEDMLATTKFLCENIQGAKLGYCQSDEISILITDYDTLNTQAWFDYEVQKMTSIGASLASVYFNQCRRERGHMQLAFFDARVFNIPREEVANYFLGRQNDAVRNSVSMLAQSLYSHKILENLNGSQMQELCFQKGHNWNDLDYQSKRGGTVMKMRDGFRVGDTAFTERMVWQSVETPMKFDQQFIDNILKVKEE